MTDLYCDIIDNYGDMAFAIKVINTYTFEKKEQSFRFFSNNRDLYDVFSKNLLESAQVTYYNLSEVQSYTPSSKILNLFEIEIHYSFLESFEFPIHLTDFTYFSLEAKDGIYKPGIIEYHDKISTHSNLTVKHFSVSLLNFTGGAFSEKIYQTKILEKEYFLEKYHLNTNKKWISVFCYPETQSELEKTGFFESFGDDYIFLSFGKQVLSYKNSMTLPFLSMQEYASLLHYCEGNIVRGENSMINAMESGKPFYWDIYKENNGAHREKIHDFCEYLKLNGYGDEYVRAQKLGNLEYKYGVVHKIFTQKKES
ncbi:elongation factor P maturation arginine rhamnosyltransferase EarP [Candidatus Gracilibacteria bacterium]|nr:elongation factor P maturation arginine rhamnosyltransferase EarP [Candidatus Gracilibacteria bacterium]